MKPAATTREERLLIDGRLVAADAVAIANNSAYGLSGMVVSPSAERARRVAERVRTGTISVNGGLYYGADAPFGGYRQSGIGRESGLAGFEEYLEIKTIAEAC
jgi:aldehyde dehydrogenase (NAD+)